MNKDLEQVVANTLKEIYKCSFNQVWLAVPCVCRSCANTNMLAETTFYFITAGKDFEKLERHEHGIYCIIHGLLT